MQPQVEGLVKLILLASLFLAGMAAWLVPHTRLSRHRRVGERLFVATQVVGMACGATGLVVIFAWPQRVLEWHLWELTILPYALVYFCWIIVMRRARSLDVLDEKQDVNMANAGGLTVGVTVLAMGAAFVLGGEGLFDPSLWYPYYLFVTVLLLSASTLVFFKRR